MVAAERAPYRATASGGGAAVAAARRRGQQLAVALVAVASVIALATGQMRERAVGAVELVQTSKLDIPGKDDSYDGISSGLMGSLEKAMDASIDNKVSAFLSAPAIGAVPIPDIGSVMTNGGSRGAFVPKAYAAEYADKMATSSYLAKLGAQKRQLEREKAKLMHDLRARHKAAQIAATKESIAYNQLHLQRAQEIAQFRLAQQAQQAARAMAKKMREANIAKQTYIHAQAVANHRIRDLDAMVRNTNEYGHFLAKPETVSGQQLSSRKSAPQVQEAPAPDAKPAAAAPAPTKRAAAASREAKGVSSANEDAKKGTKLYQYLQQEKQLEAKIKAAERAAKKHTVAASKSAATKPHHKASVQSSFIHTIARALYDNKEAIKKDEDAASLLKKKQEALYASMKALKHSDELLFQKVKAEDSKM